MSPRKNSLSRTDAVDMERSRESSAPLGLQRVTNCEVGTLLSVLRCAADRPGAAFSGDVEGDSSGAGATWPARGCFCTAGAAPRTSLTPRIRTVCGRLSGLPCDVSMARLDVHLARAARRVLVPVLAEERQLSSEVRDAGMDPTVSRAAAAGLTSGLRALRALLAGDLVLAGGELMVASGDRELPPGDDGPPGRPRSRSMADPAVLRRRGPPAAATPGYALPAPNFELPMHR